jgi:two-component system response regulator AtoC
VVRAAAVCEGSVRPEDLPERVRNHRDVETAGLPPDLAPATEENWTSLAVVEGRYVARVLVRTHGNKQAASRLLEVDRKTLDRMIKRHHISIENVAGPPPLNEN